MQKCLHFRRDFIWKSDSILVAYMNLFFIVYLRRSHRSGTHLHSLILNDVSSQPTSQIRPDFIANHQINTSERQRVHLVTPLAHSLIERGGVYIGKVKFPLASIKRNKFETVVLLRSFMCAHFFRPTFRLPARPHLASINIGRRVRQKWLHKSERGKMFYLLPQASLGPRPRAPDTTPSGDTGATLMP